MEILHIYFSLNVYFNLMFGCGVGGDEYLFLIAGNSNIGGAWHSVA